MNDDIKKIYFCVYPSLYEKFKAKCDLNGRSCNEQVEILIAEYNSGNIGTVDFLRTFYSQERISGEKKSGHATLRINNRSYDELVNNLDKENTRPATFFTLIMAYYVASGSAPQNFALKAIELLNGSAPDIMHVVYGLKRYIPSNEPNSPWQLTHTDYFIDACTEERFNGIYKFHSPTQEVLAIHR